MSKHARRNNSLTRKVVAIGAGLALALGAIVAAQADPTTYDVEGQAGDLTTTFVQVASASRASNVITFTTSSPHHYRTNDVVSTGGFSPAGFNLDKIRVTVTGETTFTVASSGSDENATSSGIASLTSTHVPISAVVGDGTNVTFTTAEPHFFLVGDEVDVRNLGVVMTSGTGFQSEFTITSVTNSAPYTFTVASSREGAVISTAVGNGTVTTFKTSTAHGLDALASDAVINIARTGVEALEFANLVKSSVTVVDETTFTVAGDFNGTYSNTGSAYRDSVNEIGYDLALNEFIDYKDVFSVGGTQIHARVTFKSQADLEGNSGQPGLVELLDEQDSTASENMFMGTRIHFVNGAGDSYAEFEIEFFTGTPESRTVVTLENLSATTYDLDGWQYAQFSDYSRYFLSADTVLDAVPISQGVTRFIDSIDSDQRGTDSFTLGRVTVEFDSVSSFSYQVGQDTTGKDADTGSAFFQLDLSTGWDVGGAWSGVRATAATPPATSSTVTFNANEGTGSMSSQSASSSTALSTNAFTRDGFTFAGWNTESDGSGTSYADGASFPFSADDTLYAQWTAATPAAPTPYSGPQPLTLNISCLAAGSTGTAKLTGERLSTITSATVDGKPITLSDISATSITLGLPALAAGTYDIVYTSGSGSLTHQDSLRVCGSASPAVIAEEGTAVGNTATKPFFVAKRFSNYRGDRGPIVARDRAAITAFIKANPGLTQVTCVGSTSGRPALETDPALAMARAKNACSIVASLVPGVKTKLVTSTGIGVGQFFRAVTLFGKGTKTN